eukprot:scaffold130497_cov21-Tisochrysis_lutea.AAC.1
MVEPLNSFYFLALLTCRHANSVLIVTRQPVESTQQQEEGGAHRSAHGAPRSVVQCPHEACSAVVKHGADRIMSGGGMLSVLAHLYDR